VTDPRPLYARPAIWAAATVFYTVNGVLLFFYHYLDDLARGEAGTRTGRFIEEMTGAWAAIPLFVALVVIAARFPIDRPGRLRHLPVHLAAMLIGSFVHTTLNWALRSALYPLAGLGGYDYGVMRVRYFMELPNDVISYLVALGLITLVRWYHAMRERELRAAGLQRDLAQARLESLRLRLQPHFLFNALNTISSVMYEDPRAADVMIGRLSDLLRLSLSTADAQEVPLADELVALNHYVALMQARFGDALRVDVDVAPTARGAMVPALLLQPLVENAVRHGGIASDGRGWIAVRVRRDDDTVHVVVADDGPGAPAERDVLNAGTGLQATAQRLRLLYGDRQSLRAGNRPGAGFEVAITLPFRAAPEPARAGDPAVVEA
jgi:signal transduction histidine kinase